VQGHVVVVASWLAYNTHVLDHIFITSFAHPATFLFYTLLGMSLGQDAAAKRVSQLGFSLISYPLIVRASVHRVLPWINLGSKRNRKRQRYPKEHPLLHQHRL
jgi:hypothetical protein